MPAHTSLPLHIDPTANLPIFAQLRQQIVWLIASGSLKAGDRLPPIRELGDQLGIHMHTIRQAYHSLEADGLVETRPGRGTRILPYDLSKLAGLSTDLPSHTIGILLPSTDPFYDPFLQGLEEVAHRSDYLLLTSFTRDSEEHTRRLARQLAARSVDGLIAVSPVAGVLDREGRATLSGPPIVYVDAPQFSKHCVLLDLESAGFQATQHLIGHGHRRIGIITAPLKWQNFLEAFRGYERALRSARLVVDPALVIETPAFEAESGYQAALRLLEREPAITAMYVSGDVLALGALQAIKASGRRVPEDVALASKDNIQASALVDPPLTTVASPTYQMGIEAMTMLQRLLDRKPVKKQRVVLPTELVVRRSCGCTE